MNAETLSLVALIATTLVLLVRGLLYRSGTLRFSFLASTVVAGWFLPQAAGLINDPDLPPGGYAETMIMATFCLLAVLFGEILIKPKPFVRVTQYNQSRLLVGAAVLSIVGLAAYSQILNTPAEVNAEGLTSGFVTILFFFSILQYFGLAIALLLLLERFSWPALIIVFFDLNAMGSLILFGGRREAAIELFLILLCVLWFQRRFVVPRIAMVVVLALGTLIGNSIGQYRALVTSINEYEATGEARLPTIIEILQIDFLGEITTELENGSDEARNAIMYISGTDKDGRYDLGLAYWNYFVFRYVPGQLVGFGLKDNLMVDLPDNAIEAYGYTRHIGTTFTGFTDAFMSFWFFGAFVFTGISALLAHWWFRAMAGVFEAKLFYCLSITSALLTVTHSTQWFWIYLPQLFIFTIPVLIWARRGNVIVAASAVSGDLNVNRGTQVMQRSAYQP